MSVAGLLQALVWVVRIVGKVPSVELAPERISQRQLIGLPVTMAVKVTLPLEALLAKGTAVDPTEGGLKLAVIAVSLTVIVRC